MASLMTLEEVADYLRVTKKTIYRLIEKRAIPATRVGHLWRFDKALIDDWLSKSSAKVVANILVIDDDSEICSLFKDTLEDSGHIVTTTLESSTGLDMVKNGNFDLVFLDLMMPVLDGAELFKQIRAVKPDLPVTIITGYPDSALMNKALSHGPLGVVNKPFNSSVILTAVNNYLRFAMPGK